MTELAAYSTMAMTLGLVVARPRVGPTLRLTPAWAAFVGAVLLAALGAVKPEHFVYALQNLTSPFIAIGSIMVMTDVAGRVGLLEWWASKVEARADSTRALFVQVFGLGVITSSLLNNDAAILVLTPVALAMVRRRFPGRPEMAVPFAFAVFMSAGVAALPISNPMNMVVADFCGIDFNTYARHMIPVAAAGWLLSYVSLRLLFARQLRVAIADVGPAPAPASTAQRQMMLLLGIVLVSYPLAASLGGRIWMVASAGAALSLLLAHQQLRARPLDVIRHGVSWETLAFLLAVLVMSLGLRDVGLVDRLVTLYDGAGLGVVGLASAIGSAVLNNHPMSHLNMMALAAAPQGESYVFAVLVGGDLGPRLLPMGSLAGLLWLEQLRRHHVSLSIGRFVAVGIVLAVPTLAVSLALLAIL